MPTDTASATVEVEAPFERVLETVRDVGSQPEWVREILSAEVLSTNDDGTPATAHFTAAAPVGRDDYTLAYTHRSDGLSWTLLQGRLQTGQEASYVLRALGPERTEVTFDLRISHHLPLPGLVRRRVVRGLVDSTLSGLRDRVET